MPIWIYIIVIIVVIILASVGDITGVRLRDWERRAKNILDSAGYLKYDKFKIYSHDSESKTLKHSKGSNIYLKMLEHDKVTPIDQNKFIPIFARVLAQHVSNGDKLNEEHNYRIILPNILTYSSETRV